MKFVRAFALAITTVAVFFSQRAGSSAQDGSPVYFNLSTRNGLYPIIDGTTNLPDNSVLFINVRKPWLPDGAERAAHGLPACGDDCYPATTGPTFLTGETVTVKDGKLTAGPFSFFGKPFQPGVYPIDISPSVADFKKATPDQIRAMGTIIFQSTIRVPGD